MATLMRAARVHAWGSTPVLEEIPSPSPPPGETLVAVTAAAVGHYDLAVARGEVDPGPPLPYVPGTDGAGTVVASGAHPEGAVMRIAGGGVGLRRDGTWAELVAVPDDALQPVPDGVDPAVAACFSVPGSAAYTAVHHLGRLQAGERVAVTGAAGGVGSIAVQLAHRARAAEVFGIVRGAGKAGSVPAGTTVVVGRGREAVERLREGTGGVDVLIDTVGGADLPEILGAVSPGGRVVLVGYTAGTEATFDLPALMDGDLTLLPLNLFRHRDRTREAASAVLELLRDGEIELPITRFPLDDLGTAVTSLAEGRTIGRVVLVP